MDLQMISLVASADPMGQMYKSIYIGLFGFSLLLIPRTIRNLISKQARLVTDKMEKEMQIKLHKQREQQLMENLYKYVSKEVAEKMLRAPELLDGKTVHIAALFIDIRGFTEYCSTRSAREILDFLNLFYTTVADAVKNHAGLVNKFLGDSVFAIFGAPDEFENTEQKAIKACIEVLDTMDSKHDEFAERFGIDIDIGIGMDSGNALVGNVGSTDHIEYTALGDVVNMASRFEKLNKRFKTKILFSSTVYSAIKDFYASEIVELGEHEVRGAAGKKQFYTIKGYELSS
jgi:adenylate cyclase